MAKGKHITLKVYKWVFWAIGVFAVLVAAFAITLLINYNQYLKLAHSSFDNYYAFRGCQSLVSKTDNDAACKLSDGSEIKIVKIDGKWYLDGDGPCNSFLCW